MVLVVDLRAGAGRPPLQHGSRHRRRRHLPRQVPEDPPAPGEGLLGEVLLPARERGIPGVRHGRRPHQRLHLLRPALPRVAGPRPRRGEDRLQPVSDVTWPQRVPLAARAARLAVANEYYIGAINRVGWSRSATTTSTARATSSTRGQFVGDVASTTDEEAVVRDLDMDLIEEVRSQWAFYRDRRPDMYGPSPRRRRAMARTLIKNGTVVHPSGRVANDVSSTERRSSRSARPAGSRRPRRAPTRSSTRRAST